MGRKSIIEFYVLIFGGFLIGASAVVWLLPFWAYVIIVTVFYVGVQIAVARIEEE